jgi:arylsulfatase
LTFWPQPATFIGAELKQGRSWGPITRCIDVNQMDLIAAKGRRSNRSSTLESWLGRARRRLQVSFHRPTRRLAGYKPDVPYLTNLRLDPFERTGWPDSGTKTGSQNYFQWFQYEFWRFVFVQEEVAKLIMTAVEFPPMQKGASFNLDAVKAKIEAAGGQWASRIVHPAPRRASCPNGEQRGGPPAIAQT